MNAGQNNKKPEISAAGGARGLKLFWTGTAGNGLKPIKRQFYQLALGIKKNSWAVFAVLLAAAVMEFNYYQARLTREYLRAFMVSAAQMNGEADALEAKLNQLSIKIDSLSARLEKLPLASSALHAKPRPSIFSKPR